MSTYSILNIPRPTIGYCILHQSASPKSGEAYAENIRELHASVRRESEALRTAQLMFVNETIARESQVLRGSLSEFIATPVRSDNQSVQRIFVEGLERFQSQVGGTSPLGVVRSNEGRIVFPSPQSVAEKKLASTGRTYLKELGFTPLKTKGDIYESVFIVEGGMNLDMLEHIIRDRLGIYASTHGTHLRLVGGYSFSAYNLIDEWSRQASAGNTECSFFFSKPDIEYQPFRDSIHKALDKLAANFPGVTVWQRKLGFGKGKEFIVRFICHGGTGLKEIIAGLQKDQSAKEIRTTLLEESCLLVKELVVQ